VPPVDLSREMPDTSFVKMSLALPAPLV
jgi:hypothetical protein